VEAARGDAGLIARIWRGATKAGRGDEYVEYLNETGVKEYAETPGNRGVYLLRRDSEGLARFTIVSLWDSMDAVRAFAGDDPERSVYYPEDDDYLVEREDTVEHHEVVSGP
jgi:heme-degrading monooxygenase HmoA